ncbi:hypothetical protein SAMN05421690_102232 [Nitrosomonas sp. Nm51]|uniref:hypothetical protein n=1 Tax=Nitrosomonas sp. Nm51 TaxID=133720 RepID=UPI0008D58AFF|nr:hypothetical protein [Nitrosomonas sp. Nm51]SER37731.1 hypothetical protein SAMN05421690_102232 [Nitrosomonas sp. Nm51]
MFDKRNQLIFYANVLIIIFGITVIVMSDFLIVGLLFILGAALLIYEQIQQNKGAFSISGLEKILVVKDTCGNKAELIQKQKTTACHVDNTVFWFKNINPTGSVSGFRINNQLPIEQTKDSNNNYQVCMALPSHPKAKNGLDTTLSCTYTGAFGKTECTLSHTIDNETDQLKLVVELPKGRPISSAHAYCVYNGNKEALLPPVVAGETRIETEIKKPKLGAEYRLEWTWPEANIIRKIGCYLG